MSTDLPDWIREGAKVAEFQPNWNAIDHVTFARIDRLTATQIVLDNESRYSRSKLRPVGGGRTELRAADDRDVRGAVAARAFSRLRRRVDELWRAGGDTRTVEEAHARLAEVDALLREAREAIAATQDPR